MANNIPFRVNTPTVSHEIIDGEAVIINLDSGNYYSLTGAGSVIWSLILAQQSLNEICKHVSASYDGDANEIRAGVEELLVQLESENLIVAGDSDNGADSTRGVDPAMNAERHAFRPPILQKYTDMQQLLLLDPVHDVDDMGWPRKPE